MSLFKDQELLDKHAALLEAARKVCLKLNEEPDPILYVDTWHALDELAELCDCTQVDWYKNDIKDIP